MNASKEEANIAIDSINIVAEHLDDSDNGSERCAYFKSHLVAVRDFLEAAVKKLPSEAAFQREKDRKRVKSR